MRIFSVENMNLMAESQNNYESRQVIYHWKEEYLSFIQKRTLANLMRIMLMPINEAKIEYHIVPKGTKYTGSGKLGLRKQMFSPKRNVLQSSHLFRVKKTNVLSKKKCGLR